MSIENFEVAYTIMVTLFIVPIISYIISRFESLPIDITGASISVSSLIPIEVDKLINVKGESSIANYHTSLTAIIIIVIIVLVVTSVIPFLAFQNERKTLKGNTNLWCEGAYCIALFMSMLLLFTSFLTINSIPIIYKKDIYKDTDIFLIIENINRHYNSKIILEFIIILYIFFLLSRYIPPLILKLKK